MVLQRFLLQLRWYTAAERRFGRDYSKAIDALMEANVRRAEEADEGVDVSALRSEMTRLIASERRAVGNRG